MGLHTKQRGSLSAKHYLGNQNLGDEKCIGINKFEMYKSFGVTKFRGDEGAEPPLRLSEVKSLVSEASQPFGKAIIEGP